MNFYLWLIVIYGLNCNYMFKLIVADTNSTENILEDVTSSTVKPSRVVNWTEIDNRWNAILDDEVVYEKWKKLDQDVRSGIRTVLGIISPKVISMNFETRISSNCTAGLLKWVISLKNLKDWSVKLLDAIGKPSAGILDGAVTFFGNYKQCLNLRAWEDEDDFGDEDEPANVVEKKEIFRGKYCVLEFKPHLPKKPPFYGFNTKLKAVQIPLEEDSIFKLLTDYAVLMNVINLRFDLCVPSLCTKEDIQKIVTYITKPIDFRGRVARCETEPETPISLNLNQIIAISSLICLLALFAASSILSFFLLRWKSNGILSKLIYNLSWQHAYRELEHFATYQKSHLKAPVLYGIRYIILFWIMLVHTAAIVNFQFLRDLLPLKDLAFSQPAQIVTKSSIQMDALILITAFTMGFVCHEKSFTKILKYVFKKFLRLMPSIMIIVALMVILPLCKNLLDGGATWNDILDKPTKSCENTGLFNFLFIQNFIDSSSSCLPHTWLFCVEMQLALLFIPILSVRCNYPQVGNIITILMIMVGYIVNVVTVSHLELPPTFLLSLPDQEQRNYYNNVHYFKPWTHLSTFACGILAGCLVGNIRKNNNVKKKTISNMNYSKNSNSTFLNLVYFFGWIICLSTLLSVIFSYNEWIKGDLPDPISSGFYDASQRLSWSLAQCFILYFLVCVLDQNTNIIVKFLSSKVFIFMGRLCLLAYIIHPVWQMIFLSTQQTQIYSSKFVAVYSMFGNIFVSFLLSSLISLLFEIPICSLLVSRYFVSTKHPIKPLLGKQISTTNNQEDDLNMYSVSDQTNNHFSSNNNNNQTTTSINNNNNLINQNHNSFIKENYKF